MTVTEIKKALPTEWTAEDRIFVATRLLGVIRSNISQGLHEGEGRPSIEDVLFVLNQSPDVLNRSEVSTRLGEVLAADDERAVRKTKYGECLASIVGAAMGKEAR